MNINVRTNISNEFDSTEIIINSPQMNDELQDLLSYILKAPNNLSEINEIAGTQDNKIFIIKVSDIIMFFSENKDNYCKTDKGVFKIKEKLYQLEDTLPKNSFIRISNSTIINLDHTDCFDISTLGQIIVRFKDNTYEYVSQRKVSEVMKFLKNRRR